MNKAENNPEEMWREGKYRLSCGRRIAAWLISVNYWANDIMKKAYMKALSSLSERINPQWRYMKPEGSLKPVACGVMKTWSEESEGKRNDTNDSLEISNSRKSGSWPRNRWGRKLSAYIRKYGVKREGYMKAPALGRKYLSDIEGGVSCLSIISLNNDKLYGMKWRRKI